MWTPPQSLRSNENLPHRAVRCTASSVSPKRSWAMGSSHCSDTECSVDHPTSLGINGESSLALCAKWTMYQASRTKEKPTKMPQCTLPVAVRTSTSVITRNKSWAYWGFTLGLYPRGKRVSAYRSPSSPEHLPPNLQVCRHQLCYCPAALSPPVPLLVRLPKSMSHLGTCILLARKAEGSWVAVSCVLGLWNKRHLSCSSHQRILARLGPYASKDKTRFSRIFTSHTHWHTCPRGFWPPALLP